MKNITHITTVHPRYDTRIYVKEASSLAKAGYSVSLIVADDKGNEQIKGVTIIDIGRINNRFCRIILSPLRAFYHAFKLKSDLYHFHDPELIITGILLKVFGKKVIFDVHEDVPAQIHDKIYLPKVLKPILSKAYFLLESMAVKMFDGVCVAEELVFNRLKKINKQAYNVNNYPILSEFTYHSDWSIKKNSIVYVGAITRLRGIYEMLASVNAVDVELELAGTFYPPGLKAEVEPLFAAGKIHYYGHIGRDKISELLATSKIGLAILHPVKNYKYAKPVKMFEYMAAGLPVICSNFPLWQRIIKENQCGISVDPFNQEELSQSIRYLLENQFIAQHMGKMGREAVENKYNWAIEEKKLLEMYQKILN